MRGRVSRVEIAVYAGGPVIGDIEAGIVGTGANVPRHRLRRSWDASWPRAFAGARTELRRVRAPGWGLADRLQPTVGGAWRWEAGHVEVGVLRLAEAGFVLGSICAGSVDHAQRIGCSGLSHSRGFSRLPFHSSRRVIARDTDRRITCCITRGPRIVEPRDVGRRVRARSDGRLRSCRRPPTRRRRLHLEPAPGTHRRGARSSWADGRIASSSMKATPSTQQARGRTSFCPRPEQLIADTRMAGDRTTSALAGEEHLEHATAVAGVDVDRSARLAPPPQQEQPGRGLELDIGWRCVDRPLPRG